MTEIVEETATPATPKSKKPNKKNSDSPASSPIQGIKVKLGFDFKGEEEGVELLQGLLQRANEKNFGKKIEVKDLVLLALKKIDDQDIQALQERSMSKMDKIHLAHEKYNQDNQTHLSFDEYLCLQLKIQ